MTDPSSPQARGPVRPDGSAGTWMLFRSGSATRIDVGLHEPDEGGHSAKAAYVVKECDTAMQDAAERGRLAALEWIARRGGAAAPAYRVSFDLPGVRSGDNVGGASGGLAFAVAVARAVRAAAGAAGVGDEASGVIGGAAGETDGAAGGVDGGVGGAVAAAGELGSGLSGGPVRGVQDIEAKIEGALACLPAGGRLFYPWANDPEVSAGLREKLREKGIEAMAVESVDGALDRLFPPPAADPSAHPGKVGSRYGSLSPRSGTVTPRRLAVAGLIGVSGVVVTAAALLIAGFEHGDERRPFAPDAKGGAAAIAEPGGPAGTDAGFETGAGVPSPAGHEDTGSPRPTADMPSLGARASRPQDSPPATAGTFREEPDKGFD